MIRKAAILACLLAGITAVEAAEEVVDIRDGTSIRGATELPKVLYIVPWKKAGVGDVLMQPGSSIFGEELAPIDRDVFRRQVNFHQLMGQNSAAGK